MMDADSQAHGNDGSGASAGEGLIIKGASRLPPQAVSRGLLRRASRAGVCRPGLVPALEIVDHMLGPRGWDEVCWPVPGRTFFHDPQARQKDRVRCPTRVVTPATRSEECCFCSIGQGWARHEPRPMLLL